MEKTYVVKGFNLTINGKMGHTDEKLGVVYNCFDQAKNYRLLHITNVVSTNGMLAKFYLMETKFYVLLLIYDRKSYNQILMYLEYLQMMHTVMIKGVKHFW